MKNRDRWLTGASLALMALWMSLPGHHRGGVLVGMVLTLGAVFGVLGLMGDSPLDVTGEEKSLGEGDTRPWWQREGALVALFGAILYIPLAGAFGLWDPWETHYSEVAREILSRDDWITTWWAQEGWFMSKPVLIFWMSALGMGIGSLFGMHYQADAGPNFQEWFIRMPIVLLTIGAMYALYRGVSRAWGPRAGLLAAMVLGTMPQWFFLAHQAMTDMPFVATLVIAISMFMLAVTDDPDALIEARLVHIGKWRVRVSLWHLTVGLVLVLALPQIVYLLTRPLSFSCPADANLNLCGNALQSQRIFGRVQFPIETFYSGSAGNSGVGDLPSVPGSPHWERIPGATAFFPSALQGLLWVGILLTVLHGLRAERRAQALHYNLFYVWCAVSTMGKGPGGLAIPGAVALLHLASSGRWRELYRIRLGLGILTFLLVGMPWYVAITGRLGNEFIDRFVRHDLINRLTIGVHGDTGSLRYFLWQLGYAMFPWSGLVAVAVVGWRSVVPDTATRAQKDVARIAMLWFLMAFTLFSAMATKFHHYIFPAIPGAAVMVGILLDRLMGESSARGGFVDRVRPRLVQLGAVTLAVVGAARLVGTLSGVVPANGVMRANPALGAVLLVVSAGLWWFGWQMQREQAAVAMEPSPDDARNYREQEFRAVSETAPEDPMRAAGFAGLMVGAAVLTAFIARDFVTARSTPPGSERLIHLFVYNYDRPWPSRFLDFRGPLFGFGAVAVLSLVLVCVGRFRAYASRGVVALAAVFAVWTLDVYMIQVTPHWSQRPLFERYYAMRRPATRDPRFPFDPIVAHQMNWKGENFYTGNHVVAEECGLKYCTGSTSEFLRTYGPGRVFFVTEHSRLSGLLSTIRTGGGEGHAVTTERDDNKFVLVEARVGGASGGSSGREATTPTQVR